MSLDETVDYASADWAAAAAPSRTPDRESTTAMPSLLTPRERELVRLLARGLSNREIADELVISRRTAEVHVGNILGKLGLTSRTQAALYAVEHKLVPPAA